MRSPFFLSPSAPRTSLGGRPDSRRRNLLGEPRYRPGKIFELGAGDLLSNPVNKEFVRGQRPR